MNNFLLTIAIPTYNREVYLRRLLESLFNQQSDFKDQVEIIISDNASTDNTQAVIEDFMNRELKINLITNPENIGSDRNIAQCYAKAKGKYVVAFGDDDVLYPNSVAIILDIINKVKDFGVLYLNWEVIKKDKLIVESDILLIDDYLQFYNKVSHNSTFISGNVVNSKYVSSVNFDQYFGTSLVQWPFILTASLSEPYNIFHIQPLVGVQPDNSGGFSVCKVFGENLNQIVNEFDVNPKTNRVFNLIKVRLLIESFPNWIYRIKTTNHSFSDDNNLHKTLSPVYSKFPQYWFLVYPLIILNKSIIKVLWPFYQIYVKVLGHLLNKKEKNQLDKIIKIR
ncbi:Glycosyl transferase family 2 [Mucilaginibacter lappiensis]|uniref:Glycosyltransferase involved in cell wall biosynthesis n=1 Tax=Mucilaginibacter lappiensis TaxID=354630 RepID=A0ABR6PRM4_9SPHI|nr:glycosyltransferase family 2 protein [Mucilaginibacter lappiensis]MBB6112437.1 glycosyltransferase involved in cell wall biosynthesis [Mucilaginibacter lappiensis]SIS00433.1 Glycosyl transferase family 2 [Mucilaginibacter lappiensis]